MSIASCLTSVTFSSMRPFAGLASIFWWLTCTGEPSIGPSTPDEYRESITSLYLQAVLCLTQLLMLLTFLFSTKAHCWLMASLVSTSEVIFCHTDFQPINPQPLLLSGINLVQMQNFALTFLEIHEVAASPFLVQAPPSCNTPIWSINRCSQTFWGNTVSSSKSLKRIQNSICPSSDLQSTSVVTDLNLKLVFCHSHESQFSIHLAVHIFNPYFISLSARMLQEMELKNLLKVR